MFPVNAKHAMPRLTVTQRWKEDRPSRSWARLVVAASAVAGTLGVSFRLRADAPDNQIVPDAARCEALTALGQRQDAIDACRRALQNSRSAVAARAMVRALMAGTEAPTSDELGHALWLAKDARARFPKEPWGYAAMCDIADRIGDDVMLQKCSQDLDRVSPDDPEARKARATVRSRRPTWRVWAGWFLIAAASLATLAHAVWRAMRRQPKRGHVAVATYLAVFGLLCAMPGSARAEPSPDHPNQVSDLRIDEQNPEGNIPTEEQRNRNPVEFGYWLQDLAAMAQKASKRGDHLVAIKFFTAMAKAVPDRPVSYRRLCDEYNAAGMGDKAIEACGSVLLLKDITLDDYARYMTLIVTKPGNLSRREVDSLTGLVEHLKHEPSARDSYYEIECSVAVRVDNMAELQECVDGLSATAPAAPSTILYQWTLALKRGQYGEARKAIEHGKRISMSAQSIARMEQETDDTVAQHYRKYVTGGIAMLLTLIAVGAGITLLRRRMATGSTSSVDDALPTTVGGSP